MKTNKKARDYRTNKDVRLAGGYGQYAANSTAEQDLRRLVLANLLWEDNFYVNGRTISEQIAELVPLVAPGTVADLACEARSEQKLRHVPLFLAREMARHSTHRKSVASTLYEIIRRPDEMTEFLSLYWRDGREPLAAQVKKGLAAAFPKFDEYQLAKYNRKNEIKLLDVLRLVHPTPANDAQAELWGRLINDELATPETWEVGLSAAKNDAEKRAVWIDLISRNKLGATAYLKNLRNMEKVGVPRKVITNGFLNLNGRWLLPLDYLRAAVAAPTYERQIEDMMFRAFGAAEKLPGTTIFVVDISGSMDNIVSERSQFSRQDMAGAMAMLAAEMCEDFVLYATAGDDYKRVHATERMNPTRGFKMISEIKNARRRLGHGGIFTRQCLNYIREDFKDEVDRIVIFSDSQDCDRPGSGLPKPFGKRNYIIDVSAHRNGINYNDLWTAEISGVSDSFLKYIMAYEANLQ